MGRLTEGLPDFALSEPNEAARSRGFEAIDRSLLYVGRMVVASEATYLEVVRPGAAEFVMRQTQSEEWRMQVLYDDVHALRILRDGFPVLRRILRGDPLPGQLIKE